MPMHLLMTTSLMAAVMLGLLINEPWPAHIDAHPAAASATETDANPWRHTVNGWEDSRQWTRNENQMRVEWIDDVHPLLWTSLVVLAGLIALVALSDDNACNRLLGQTDGSD